MDQAKIFGSKAVQGLASEHDLSGKFRSSQPGMFKTACLWQWRESAIDLSGNPPLQPSGGSGTALCSDSGRGERDFAAGGRTPSRAVGVVTAWVRRPRLQSAM